jgi:hypothetical protein
MIGAILSMFTGGSDKEPQPSFIGTKYSSQKLALAARDSSLRAGRDPLFYRGGKGAPQMQASLGMQKIQNIKNYVGQKKTKAAALVASSGKAKTPQTGYIAEEKHDKPQQELLTYKTENAPIRELDLD